MQDFSKTVRLGSLQTGGGRWASVYCHIIYNDGELTITGVVGPLPSGNSLGSCGQIRDELKDIRRYATGWTPARILYLRVVWLNYHLNMLHKTLLVPEDVLTWLYNLPRADKSPAWV